MKNSALINNITGKALKLILFFLMTINSQLIYSFALSSLNVNQEDYHELNNQGINSVAESTKIELKFKTLIDNFTSNSYLYEYCIRVLALLPKYFIIISETNSENNIRSSTFLYTQKSISN